MGYFVDNPSSDEVNENAETIETYDYSNTAPMMYSLRRTPTTYNSEEILGELSEGVLYDMEDQYMQAITGYTVDEFKALLGTTSNKFIYFSW